MLKYDEIIEYINNEVRSGNFEKRLPSIRAMAEIFNCSVGTVIKAYDNLEKNHIIFSLPKSGYYLIKDSIKNSYPKETVIDFSSGTPDFTTFPYKNFQHCLNKSIDLYKEKLFNYSDPQGLNTLINVLVKHLRQYQIFTKSENIIITSSSQQALNILSAMPFPNGKSNILVEQPTYYGMIKSLELNNITALGIERNFYGINLDQLEKMFKYENIKFFYSIPRFHNPTGTSFSRQEKEYIAQLAEKYNVYIVEDDIAADLDINRKNDPLFTYDNSSKIIYLKSYSKILMPGLRVAAVILPRVLINTFLDYKEWTDMNSPILSQGALEIYIKSGMFDKQKKEMIKLYTEKMSILEDVLLKYGTSKIKWNVPKSGYFACFYAENGLNLKQVIGSLRKKNIELFDTTACFLKEYKNDNYLRIGISKASEKEIKNGIPIVIDTILKYL